MLLLYPFVVYFGLNHFSPSALALILFILVLIRLIILRDKLSTMPWILPAGFIGAVVLLFSLFSDSYLSIKLYPLMMNLTMLVVFAYSYLNPPTVIETFARIKEPDLSANALYYINKVTLVWCLFFVVNGLISLYTALFSSLEVWTFYNGFLSYVLMALLMAVEFIIRLKVKKRDLQQTAQKNSGHPNG